jgi:hypothetical protein
MTAPAGWRTSGPLSLTHYLEPKEESMAPASTTLHEPAEQLREETINLHRAIVSLIEELEARW